MKVSDHLAELLKDPEFKKEYDALGPSVYTENLKAKLPKKIKPNTGKVDSGAKIAHQVSTSVKEVVTY